MHPLTPILVNVLPLSPFSICNGPWHPLYSAYVLDSPLEQPLSRSSLVFPLVLNPQLHIFLHPSVGLAFGGTGLCSYRVRGVGGSCAEHLTVDSYTIIISLQSYLLLLVFHHPLTLSVYA